MENNFDAETSLIGCLLLEPEKCAGEVFSEIDSIEIFNDACREVFNACKKAYTDSQTGGKYDPSVIITMMPNADLKQFALQCAEICPALSNWKVYVRAVNDAYAKRAAVEKANKFTLKAMDGSVDISELQSMAEDIVKPFNGAKQAVAETAKESIAEFEKDICTDKEYMTIGLPTVDACSYIERGDLIVVGGRPSAGKTAICLNFMEHMAKKYKCVFFSLETNKKKIRERIISSYAQIPMSHIKSGHLNEDDKRNWELAKPGLVDLDYEIVEASGKTAQWIRNEAVRRGAEVVFIDYLGIVKSFGKSRYEQVTNAINDFHIMAQSEKITTFVLSQSGRASLQNEFPSMSDLKESGGIEEASDIVILLHNGHSDMPSPSEYQVIVGKNKEGRCGTICANFDGSTQTVLEISSDIESNA